MVDGHPEQFRLVGMDHFNAMFEDSSTKSWWRQVNGEAVIGPNKGKQLRELRGEFQPRVQEIMRNAHQQIAATLTPEQREKYQRLSRERWGRGPMMRPRE